MKSYIANAFEKGATLYKANSYTNR